MRALIGRRPPEDIPELERTIEREIAIEIARAPEQERCAHCNAVTGGFRR